MDRMVELLAGGPVRDMLEDDADVGLAERLADQCAHTQTAGRSALVDQTHAHIIRRPGQSTQGMFVVCVWCVCVCVRVCTSTHTPHTHTHTHKVRYTVVLDTDKDKAYKKLFVGPTCRRFPKWPTRSIRRRSSSLHLYIAAPLVAHAPPPALAARQNNIYVHIYITYVYILCVCVCVCVCVCITHIYTHTYVYICILYTYNTPPPALAARHTF